MDAGNTYRVLCYKLENAFLISTYMYPLYQHQYTLVLAIVWATLVLAIVWATLVWATLVWATLVWAIVWAIVWATLVWDTLVWTIVWATLV